MSIYIKGMEMPTGGNETIIRIQPDGTVLDQYGHHLAITAVPVPPHGRLGDLDELYAHLNEWYLTNNPVFTKEEALYVRAMLLGIVEAPTVIEASGKDVNATTKEET